MTTEYYQIPSQQGFLPLNSGDSADPWLASATSSLSLSDWSVSKKQVINSPPSLFEPGDAEASVSWKHVIPLQYSAKSQPSGEVLSPVAPKRFNTSTSKIDAWSVVVDSNAAKLSKNNKQVKQYNNKQQQVKQVKQVKQQSPQPTAEEKPIEDELSQQNRYKTELCKSYTETGNCRYGTKCQFAHGKEEIRGLLRHPKYKTEICKTFHTTGTCPYGMRCRFIHTRSKEESIVVAVQVGEEEDIDDDIDTHVNPPPGIAAPQWSQSWTMSMSPVPTSKNARRVAVAAPEPAF